MQKLQLKLKNVPTNTSQVCSSTSLQLNKEETLSVVDGMKNDKLTLNNPEIKKSLYCNCLLCNKENIKQLGQHLRKSHDISTSQYLEKFPTAFVSSTSFNLDTINKIKNKNLKYKPTEETKNKIK